MYVLRSWATSLLCGNGDSGQEHNTSFALFPCLISLTVSIVNLSLDMVISCYYNIRIPLLFVKLLSSEIEVRKYPVPENIHAHPKKGFKTEIPRGEGEFKSTLF